MLAARRHELPERVARRCEFIVAESARAEATGAGAHAGDRPAVARLCAESFAGARDLYEICSPAMEAMMDAMLAAPGVIGARQAGAGFGGCMVALVDAGRTDDFRSRRAGSLLQRDRRCVPEIYPVEAAPGAAVFDREADQPMSVDHTAGSCRRVMMSRPEQVAEFRRDGHILLRRIASARRGGGLPECDPRRPRAVRRGTDCRWRIATRTAKHS